MKYLHIIKDALQVIVFFFKHHLVMNTHSGKFVNFA